VAEEDESEEEAPDPSFEPHEFADRWQDLLEAEERLKELRQAELVGGPPRVPIYSSLTNTRVYGM